MGMFAKKPIMLAEDNSDDEMLTLRALKQNNIANEVVIAHDGVEVLDFLFCQGSHSGRDPALMPAMLLLDLKMPKMGGLEVLEHLRADPRTELLPIIILTSSKEEHDLIQGYKLHANSYIRKPVNFTQFIEAVKQIGMYWLVLNEPPPSRACQ
jgi:two-component system response regulator